MFATFEVHTFGSFKGGGPVMEGAKVCLVKGTEGRGVFRF